MTPATATHSKNFVLVRKAHTALVGGRLALATFQLMPPFGRSMIKRVGWPATPPENKAGGCPIEAEERTGCVAICRLVAGRGSRGLVRSSEYHAGGGGEPLKPSQWHVAGRGSLADRSD